MDNYELCSSSIWAIFVVAKELGTLSGWQKCLTIGALLLTGGYGLLSLFKVQYDLGKARKRLDDAESHIFSMDEARWFGIERDSDPYLRGLLFTIALGLVQILGATFVAVYLLAKS